MQKVSHVILGEKRRGTLRVAHGRIVVDKRIRQITRERHGGGKWQAVLTSHDTLRRSHGVSLFHDTRRSADDHPRQVLRL